MAQDGRERALGQTERLAELAVDNSGIGHRGLHSFIVDRFLSIITQVRQVPVYIVCEEISEPADDRVAGAPLYQHYSQAMDAALREAGFDDIGPSAGNVFPFAGARGDFRVGAGGTGRRAQADDDAGGRTA